jgi:TPR repeat protein
MGHGVLPNYAEALKLFRKAADQGFAPAKSALSAMCRTQTAEGCRGISPNP